MFQIARGYWPQPAVMTFLKSGLAGVTLGEADEIENYLLQHNLRGRAWDDPKEWRFQRRLTTGGDEEAPPAEPYETRGVDTVRRQIVERLRPFLDKVRGSAPITIRQLAVEVFETFERFRVAETISGWVQAAQAAGDLELAGEHGQVWAELVDLFEQMVDLLGDEQVSPADFADVLEAGLERFDLALTPPTVDQVLVGQVDRTRTPGGLRAAFVLGMNDGRFPRRAQDETILSHTERRELKRRRVELDPDLHRRQLDEQLLGYVALTRASERLVVSRPLVDEGGKPTEPSPFWERLRTLFAELEPERVPREAQDDVRHLSTPRQLMTCLMRWARSGKDEGGRMKGEGGGQTEASLYQWLATHECCDNPTDLYRFRAWKALSYSNEAQLSRDISARLFPAPLAASARQLETFAACPFRHFMRYGMRLADRSSHDVTAMDLSHVYHEVLEIVAAEMLESRREWQDLSPEQAREMVGTFASAVAQRLRGEVLLSTARSRYLLQRVERTLEQVIASVKEALARGSFRPAFAGLSFGDGARVPALKVRTPGGAEVHVSGQIDRVDLLEGDAPDPSFAVFDYKLGAKPLPMGHLYHGLSLQLLTYLLVLQANGRELTGKPLTPAAGFYAQLLRGYQRAEHPDEADDPTSEDFPLRWKPRGVFVGKFLPDLDAQVAPGEYSKVVQAYLKQDGQFGRRDSTDIADAQEFAALLEHVRTRLGQLADGVMSGAVEAAPYRIGTETPCPRCEFRSVCRFEPYVNRYRHLVPLRRGDALDRIAGREGGNGG
jgi:ATP-dependent helicase/nuclease subunit B